MIDIETWDRKLSLSALLFWVYGESGVGKTRFASTWPNPLFLDMDKGMMSVTEKVDRVDINSWYQLQDVWRFLQAGQHNYKTLVFDTLNELQVISMGRVLSEFPTIKRSYGDHPAPGDWGKSLDDFDKMVREFMKFGLHVVFISQVAKREFETDPVMPDLSGKKTAGKLARKMDIIGYMSRQTIKDQGGESRTVPALSFHEQVIVSKDRTGVLPDVVYEPTYAKLATFWSTLNRGDSND